MGERPVGPVPLRRCRVGLDGLVATHLTVGGEVVVAALPAVTPCAGGRDPGVDLRRRLTVGNDRCGPPSCHAMSSGVRLSTSGRLPWASRVSRTLPRHDRSLSRSLGQKRVACRQACRMGDCCSQVAPGRHAKLRRCAECTNGTWNPDDGGSVSAKMDAIEDLTSQMP